MDIPAGFETTKYYPYIAIVWLHSFQCSFALFISLLVSFFWPLPLLLFLWHLHYCDYVGEHHFVLHALRCCLLVRIGSDVFDQLHERINFLIVSVHFLQKKVDCCCVDRSCYCGGCCQAWRTLCFVYYCRTSCCGKPFPMFPTCTIGIFTRNGCDCIGITCWW